LVIKYKIKKAYLFFTGILVFILITNLFSKEILTAYAKLFTIDNATKGADCILILSGNARTRPDKAAELIQENYSQALYYTDQKRVTNKHQDIIAYPFDTAQKILATYNLSAVIIPSIKGGATSTFDEAYDLRAFLMKHPMKHIILVTDSFHTARAHYAFEKVLNDLGKHDIKIQMAAARNDIFNESNWWKSESGISAYILEPIKYLFYVFNASNLTLVKESV